MQDSKTSLNTPKALSNFGQEVYEGLTAFPKKLSSKYFYDVVGDKLFQDIMAMPSYYLTNAEFAIFEKHKSQILAHFYEDGKPFSLIELGAGDGKKTKVLLRHFIENNANFNYRPIDISQNALELLETDIKKEFPAMAINPLQGDYFETLKAIRNGNTAKKVILFLGSNIGNLLHEQAVSFLTKLANTMDHDDMAFIGFDQKKNPQTILDAYNDATGITAAFNKNILTRINSELGGDFELDKFLHWEVYDPETGTAKSYLVAKEAQEIDIKSIGLQVKFKAWETIHTEISQKYDDDVVTWLGKKAGLQIIAQFTDENQIYKNYIFKKNRR